jgi:MoxR-like ATPase
MLRNLRKHHPIDTLGAVVDGAELLALAEAISEVHVDETLERYILALVAATRTHADLALGASPRGSLALYKTSQALAALRGRKHVLPDDIKLLVPLTLAHRLIVKPDSQLRGRTAALVLEEILKNTPLDIGELQSRGG